MEQPEEHACALGCSPVEGNFKGAVMDSDDWGVVFLLLQTNRCGISSSPHRIKFESVKWPKQNMRQSIAP